MNFFELYMAVLLAQLTVQAIIVALAPLVSNYMVNLWLKKETD